MVKEIAHRYEEMVFRKPVWADSDHFSGVYVMWQPNDQLGILMVQPDQDHAPKLIFCSLFDDPQGVFINGVDRSEAGLTIAEMRAVLDRLEEAWVTPGPYSDAP